MTLPGHWSEMPSEAFRALPAQAVAVLPLGATEQHGPHLPTGVDSLLVRGVLDRALPQLPAGTPVLALPVLEITRSVEHDAWPGTISLGPPALLDLLEQIGASVARAGVGRLFLLNGHGGNTALLEVAVRELRKSQGLITAHASWFGFADTADWGPEALAEDLHGGDLETSAMLALRPELVRMDRAGDFTTRLGNWARETPAIGLSGQPVRPGWLAQDLQPTGAMGHAAAATREKGEKLLASAARGLAQALEQFMRFSPAPPEDGGRG